VQANKYSNILSTNVWPFYGVIFMGLWRKNRLENKFGKRSGSSNIGIKSMENERGFSDFPAG
jgi:hypothetical protein